MTESNGASNTPKPSKAEAIKEASGYLRQWVAEDLGNDLTHFSEEAAAVLKFSGTYQQDDRDVRLKLKREKQEKAYSLMVRVRIVGGRLTADQYLACDELAREVGNGTLRITTRQELQLHGVLKRDLAVTIRHINEQLLSTLAACGDVERNVLACSAPIKDRVHEEMIEDARVWAAHAAPRSTAYCDIWLDGEKYASLPDAGPPLLSQPGDDPVEPILGKAYLPRKFKTAFAFPDDNCTDIHANDLGYLAIVEDGRIVGYNVLVGGGMGTTPSADKTFPFLAVPLCYVPRDQIRQIGEAVIRVFRDFGNRSDRKRARLKYVISDWGIEAFRAKVEEYIGRRLDDPLPVTVTDVDDHMGWSEQGDGKLFLGIPVENGRIKDEGSLRLFSGLRAFVEKYKTPVRLTCQQKLILADLEPAWRDEINSWLEEYGIASVEKISNARRWSMACPALPTCGLAVTDAERALPSVIDQLEAELARQGLEGERLTVRMTGCPNGCARPYNSDIGLVGRSAKLGPDGVPGPGTYTILLGGRAIGDRLNVEFKDYVPHDQIVAELSPVFARFVADRIGGETFGDFCDRVGVAELGGVPAIAEAEAATV
ncbi:MAG: NADPH-dependent assimilatory sulfite reductase hemoprotein subunit [Paludisphaera borealis]|uniref:NADPH-dependent assimilatory sulfite reductase hemoprotein subunit n=1 Tax=Paludisphaera borealis TaxID=1387353 RepID=UPI0028520382|nr:NADPH-dependent assimilatory sulfite reductase hemoprotein subunit [Paludisphaera borealis]MDR3621453.1 NADPH-dependent assimilatory sulfite reductase hemoprotein subunit [Paludisphaera borealis]